MSICDLWYDFTCFSTLHIFFKELTEIFWIRILYSNIIIYSTVTLLLSYAFALDITEEYIVTLTLSKSLFKRFQSSLWKIYVRLRIIQNYWIFSIYVFYCFMQSVLSLGIYKKMMILMMLYKIHLKMKHCLINMRK